VERKVAEAQKWIFIGDIPLLCEAKRVARQLEIEVWLDPLPMLKAFNLKMTSLEKSRQLKYVA